MNLKEEHGVTRDAKSLNRPLFGNSYSGLLCCSCAVLHSEIEQ
jgi:hypothetical protein